MTDEKSGTRSSVGLLDIVTHVPGLLLDAPTVLRGVITGFGARPSAKTSIGKVFQDRAARHADKVFIKFGDERITYREANETANRYAAVLAARGVGHGDVVGIMLRNSPQSVLLMLATVKCGAIAGMLNFHQRGDVLKHSIGLLEAQAYRVAFWRVASDEINYRRFFDINDLAALRMENEAVFEATHRFVLDLAAEGKVHGFRIDHPDNF